MQASYLLCCTYFIRKYPASFVAAAAAATVGIDIFGNIVVLVDEKVGEADEREHVARAIERIRLVALDNSQQTLRAHAHLALLALHKAAQLCQRHRIVVATGRTKRRQSRLRLTL